MKMPANGIIEPVGQIQLQGAQVQATVLSTGCTQSAHFVIEHEVREQRCYLTLLRTKPDYCRAAPFGVEVVLAWDVPPACVGLPVAFDNPTVDLPDLTEKSAVTRQLKNP